MGVGDSHDQLGEELGESGRVFTGSLEASARRQLGPDATMAEQAVVIERLLVEHARLAGETQRLRGLIGRSIRVIEQQNERLASHGLEAVAAGGAHLNGPGAVLGADGSIDLRS